ncbi:hypothetical protein HN014_03990 [Aquimarina sp. TRL1]|uniref:restriction endonuclease subunit S n=1 Tax=Aquimarina sp. (strain TRL1) TaxID=2736252 RepID=UPI00158EA0D7|nr:restriction endonuclease subunit S [Aquimarina sp. TRL1]QKX04103.1 hypothetical protein HN014_03990 [Aquimarina sp. TRL1]
MIKIDIHTKTKKGYKQTKLGWIPEDWNIVKLGSVIDKIVGGGTPSKSKIEYWDGDISWATVKDLSKFNRNSTQQNITGLGLKNSSANLIPANTIIIATRMLLGVAVRYNIDVSINQDLKALFTNDKIYDPFLLQWFEKYKGRVDYLGSGSTVKGISLKAFKAIKIKLPPLPEQQKIASILSTWDRAIAAQEQLIAQKHELKKELVTSLIKGEARFTKKTEKWKKTSLGRIPDDWHLVKLKDLTVEKGIVRGPFGGALKKEVFVEKGYKVYEQKNAIYQTVELGKYFIDDKKFDELKRFSVKGKDLIISCSGTIGRIYEIPKDSPEGVINQALLKLTLDNEVVLNDFFVEQFKWDRIQSSVIDSTQGGAMKNLVSISEFKNTNFIIPPIEEQRNIVSVFNSSKKEIENLKLKLVELKKQKLGLMQQLLTGEKRVRI